MKFSRGTSRVVVIFPRFVLKFPIINLLGVWELFCENKGDLRAYWDLPLGVDGFKGLLFRGIVANWNEFSFYVRTQNPLLQPTFFSLCGLVNIQKYGESCKTEREIFEKKMRGLMTESQFSTNSHLFSNPANFTINGESLKIVDYGNPKCWPVVLELGETITNAFVAQE